MRHISTFSNFLNEVDVKTATAETQEPTEQTVVMPGTYTIKWKIYDQPSVKNTAAKRYDFEYEITNDSCNLYGTVLKDSFVLAMSKDSTGLYSLGSDIEKFSGIPEADVIRDVKAGKETPDDAIIYGMCNIMNGGGGYYFWTNGTRLAGQAKSQGVIPALMEQLVHEAGVHLTRKVLVRMVAQKAGLNLKNEDWVKHDYGTGEYNWPAMGDPTDVQPIVMIDEETFATTTGAIVSMVADEFFKMASLYVPQATALTNL